MSAVLRSVVAPKSFAFIFPMASGHINPSLPVARSLVEQGHSVHYLCRDNMREAIEDTGATFHSDVATETELYEGREADVMGAMESLKKEYEMEKDSLIQSFAKLANVQLELMLPGVLRFLDKVDAKVVVYCPILNPEACLGARVRGIPSVGLLTTAGPGSLTAMFEEFLAMEQVDPNDLDATTRGFQPNTEAVQRMNETYGVDVELGVRGMNPMGYISDMSRSACTLVTTSEDLQDPVTPELERQYKEDKASFVFVGPLLDKQGAVRASTHKNHGTSETSESSKESEKAEAKPDIALSSDDLITKVVAARAEGRRVVFASMGTVVTGDSPNLGWDGRMPGPDGQLRGLTGKELCHGAWGGAFDAFGAATADEGPLIVLSVGPQPEPLGDLVLPPNAICMPSVPQVDLLRAGIDVFLTHGGQNSFTEAMAHGTPVVVCPGFGDQIVNSRKAVNLGVGLKADRPDPDAGMEAEAVASYRNAVRKALLEVSTEASFAAAAATVAQRLQQAGGVQRAVEIVVAAAEAAPAAQTKATKVMDEPAMSPTRAAIASAGA